MSDTLVSRIMISCAIKVSRIMILSTIKAEKKLSLFFSVYWATLVYSSPCRQWQLGIRPLMTVSWPVICWFQVIFFNPCVSQPVGIYIYLHYPGLTILKVSLVVAIYRHRPAHADSTVDYGWWNLISYIFGETEPYINLFCVYNNLQILA